MIVSIKNGKYTARVNSMGGELVSFSNGEKEYIWQGDEKHWKGQNPVLFPVLCSLKDDKATIDEVEVNLPKHGFARKSEFEICNISDSSVTVCLKSNDQLKKSYPFDFELRITYSIGEGSYLALFEVINTGNKTMLFHLGGHTGFNLPISGNDGFDQHKLIFDEKEFAVNYKAPTGGLIVNPEGSNDVLWNSDSLHLNYSMFDNDAIILSQLKSQSVSLVASDGHGVRMTISDFAALGIWTPAHKNAPFVCIEPWNGLPAFINESGRFEDKPFALSLIPGKKYTASYSVEII